jgi:hypothetical protein
MTKGAGMPRYWRSALAASLVIALVVDLAALFAWLRRLNLISKEKDYRHD